MIKLPQLAIFSVLASAVLVFAAGPSGETLKQTATVAQLEAAIGRNVNALETLLAEEKNFADNLTKDKIFAKAATIAVIAQAVLEHPDAKSAKCLGAYVRESAKRLSGAETYMNARLQLGEIKLAAAGKVLGYDAVSEDDWYDLLSTENMMEELNFLQGDLRRTVRRSSDPEADSLDAVAASLLALACKEKLDYTSDKTEDALWQELSDKLAVEYRNLGEAMRKKDTDAARTHHANAAKICTACHDKFRE